MTQSIETKFRGPTDTRGAQVLAQAISGRAWSKWDHNLSEEENHLSAAKALAYKLGWGDVHLIGGSNRAGTGYNFVIVPEKYQKVEDKAEKPPKDPDRWGGWPLGAPG